LVYLIASYATRWGITPQDNKTRQPIRKIKSAMLGCSTEFLKGDGTDKAAVITTFARSSNGDIPGYYQLLLSVF